MDPVTKLVRLDTRPIRLTVHASKKKSLSAHEIIIRLNNAIRVAHHIGSHCTYKWSAQSPYVKFE